MALNVKRAGEKKLKVDEMLDKMEQNEGKMAKTSSHDLVEGLAKEASSAVVEQEKKEGVIASPQPAAPSIPNEVRKRAQGRPRIEESGLVGLTIYVTPEHKEFLRNGSGRYGGVSGYIRHLVDKEMGK